MATRARDSSTDASLLSPQAMGGLRARRGMSFQDLWTVHHLMVCVLDPLFAGIVNEGAEDIDTFWYLDESCTSQRIERFQLKDRLIDKKILSEVIGGFHRKWKSSQSEVTAKFTLVAPACDEKIWSLSDYIERVRNTRTSYAPSSSEYKDTMQAFRQYLEGLGVKADAEFVCDQVRVNFRAGWVQSDEDFVRWNTRMLQLYGVNDEQKRQDAFNALRIQVASTQLGKLFTAELVEETLSKYRDKRTRKTSSARAAETASRGVRASPVLCEIRVFPGASILLRFSDGRIGLIDCGPDSVRYVVPYLVNHNIGTLDFVAISHWHYQSYAGMLKVLDAVSPGTEVWLATNPDGPSVTSAAVRKTLRWQLKRPSAASTFFNGLQERERQKQIVIRCVPGVNTIYEAPKAATERYGVYSIAPADNEGRRYGEGEMANNLCAVYTIEIGDQQVLVGTHAQVKRWTEVLRQADQVGKRLQASVFVLPHFGSRVSLSSSILESTVRRSGFLAILPTSDFFCRPKYQFPADEILTAVRKHKGTIVSIADEPIQFILTRDGVFRKEF